MTPSLGYEGRLIDHKTAMLLRDAGKATHVVTLVNHFLYLDGLAERKPRRVCLLSHSAFSSLDVEWDYPRAFFSIPDCL